LGRMPQISLTYHPNGEGLCSGAFRSASFVRPNLAHRALRPSTCGLACALRVSYTRHNFPVSGGHETHDPNRPPGRRAGGVLPRHGCARGGAGFAHWRHHLAGGGPVPVLLRRGHVCPARGGGGGVCRAGCAVRRVWPQAAGRGLDGPVLFAERKLAARAIANGHDGWAAQAFSAGKDPFTCWDPGHRRVRKACLESDGGGGLRARGCFPPR
jgi:hypothetical protein